ncbi:MAG: succinylglutamate desuccinylase/aspartoacylase family protein [Myxococcales bacterium]|nr:succinylglutamate desuccinylase/aspartoacylase family protein [Myxococcales bacterium]MCB9549650.1 succinylglutamate desuccinylase/aspartoacylase family protein [Myxococcales bacterium]
MIAADAQPGEGQRDLGDVQAEAPGPTVIVIAAIHGNEPAGVLAARQVIAALQAGSTRLCGGRVAGLVGNLGAMQAGVRGRVRDLNRAWTADQIAAVRAQHPDADDPEQAEQRALLGRLEDLFETARGPVVVLDLHTTSGGGPPFTVPPDTLAARRLGLALPFPLILGLLESVDGTVGEWVTRRGHTGLGVETGQHTDPQAVSLHAATIWRILHALGQIDAEPPEVAQAFAQVPADLPSVVVLAHRHGVTPGDGFHMRPGYAGFQRVRRGEVLAFDRAGPVVAPMTGRLLMPLYQQQGSDGFFVVRDVRRPWLVASSVLRRAGGHLLVRALGARMAEEELHFDRPPGAPARALLVLLGYRRQELDGQRLRAHRLQEPRRRPRRR